MSKAGAAWEEHIKQFPKLKESWDSISEVTRAWFGGQIDIFAGKYPPNNAVGLCLTKVISAFPGTGKTWFVNNSSFKSLDSDSSKFDKAKFPGNYIDHIQANIGKYDFIFVSSHREVRDALSQVGVNFISVYPHMSCRKEYLQRYKERGNDQKFINTLDVMWEEWIEDLDCSYHGASIRLMRGQYISDIFPGYTPSPNSVEERKFTLEDVLELWECGYDNGWVDGTEADTHMGSHNDDNFNMLRKKQYFKEKFNIDL